MITARAAAGGERLLASMTILGFHFTESGPERGPFPALHVVSNGETNRPRRRSRSCYRREGRRNGLLGLLSARGSRMPRRTLILGLSGTHLGAV